MVHGSCGPNAAARRRLRGQNIHFLDVSFFGTQTANPMASMPTSQPNLEFFFEEPLQPEGFVFSSKFFSPRRSFLFCLFVGFTLWVSHKFNCDPQMDVEPLKEAEPKRIS